MASYRKFVESKGYGWVFEVEDDDDVSEQRPLVEELEIDFQDILRKLRWSLRPPKEGVGEISDFWGPLMVMFCYAALVVWGQLEVVSWVISIWICGGGIVFAVARVLGSEVRRVLSLVLHATPQFGSLPRKVPTEALHFERRDVATPFHLQMSTLG
uniref:Uncharacterized protein n=1 Tax=Chrysotila carterae TaxID=13221 RepID=A0A6S9Q2V5_CHRCT